MHLFTVRLLISLLRRALMVGRLSVRKMMSLPTVDCSSFAAWVKPVASAWNTVQKSGSLFATLEISCLLLLVVMMNPYPVLESSVLDPSV